MTGVSVCTLVRGRTEHLANLITGLSRQTHTPDELVVAHMQEEAATIGAPFPVRDISVPGEMLPLAQARNRAAAAARGDVLIFLDADCIPGPDLVATYAEATRGGGRVAMGATRYLRRPVAGDWSFDALWREAVRHPARLDPDDNPATVVALPDFGELWGLSFALAAADFTKAGGFDERFIGYGGEETDFARALEDAGLTLAWLGAARAVHQWHPVAIPPLQHFDDIVRNARLYHQKRGDWPMTYWLDQFEAAGFIERRGDITILRRPTEAERQAAFRFDVAFS